MFGEMIVLLKLTKFKTSSKVFVVLVNNLELNIC